MVNFHFGPWVWQAAGPGGRPPAGWSGPPGTVSAIDFRPDASQVDLAAVPGGTPGDGLFAVDTSLGFPAPGAAYANLGNDPAGVLTLAQRNAWRNRLGIAAAFAGTRLFEVLSETLTDKSDPTGGTRARPLGVTGDGRLEIHVGGGRLFDRTFGGASDPAWARIQIVERDAYRRTRADALAIGNAIAGAVQGDGTVWAARITAIALRTGATFADVRQLLATRAREKFRRYLGAILRKFQPLGLVLADVVPPDLIADAVPLEPETTLSDAYTNADGTNITSHTGGGFTWAVVQGAAVITGNTLNPGNFYWDRADSPLSSADHYAQSDIINSSHQSEGVGVRAASSGFVRYNAENYFNSFQGSKFASDGTETRFINDFTNPGNNFTARADINGSTFKGYVNGSLRWTTTDTTITGNLYTGNYIFWSDDNDTRVDNFTASDGLGAPPAGGSVFPFFRRGIALSGGTMTGSGGYGRAAERLRRC